METLTLNLVGRAKSRVFEGRNYLVAPLTLIVPGVLNGSRGPLFYPAAEIAKSRAAWDHIPLVVYHPSNDQGQGISAKSTGVLEKSGVGFLQNISIDFAGKLRAEGWFDVDKTSAVDRRVLNSLQENQPMELSTGLGTDNEDAPEGSVFNGVSYSAIARNYVPDHLAILPDQVGACSIQDGCGLLVNQKGEVTELEGTTNELSNDSIKEALRTELRERFGSDNSLGPMDSNVFIEDMFQNRVIFSRGDTFFSLPFTRSNEKVVLAGDLPTAVTKVIRWRPVTGNTQNEDKENDEMAIQKEKRVEMVKALIENSCCYGEENRSDLEGLSDTLLTNAVSAVEKAAESQAVSDAARKGFTDPGGNAHTWNAETNTWDSVVAENKEEPGVEEKPDETTEETVVNEEKKPSLEEWMKSAPVEVQNTLKHAQAIEQKEKDAIIAHLTSNVAEDTKEGVLEVLNTKTLAELTVLQVLAPKPVAQPGVSYVGASVPTGTQVANAEEDGDILGLPE